MDGAMLGDIAASPAMAGFGMASKSALAGDALGGVVVSGMRLGSRRR